MSTVKLTKWGNSVGIRIPTAIITAAHLTLGEELQIVANKKGTLTLTPVTNPQAGWTDAFNAIADSKEDELVIDLPNEFDGEEWR